MAGVSPKSDPQREELYKLEKRGLSGLSLATYTRTNHRVLLKQLTKAFGVVPTPLYFQDDKTCAGKYDWWPETRESRITLSTHYAGSRSPLTLVHEFAHHVMACWDAEDRLHGHGPEWVGVYGDCLAVAGLVPYEGFRALCVRYKVDYLDTSLANTIPKLRKMVKKRAAEAAQRPHPKKAEITLRQPNALFK